MKFLLFCSILIVLLSCKDNKANLCNSYYRDLPYFDSIKIDTNNLYVIHGWLNQRSPTLIEINQTNGKVVYLENEQYMQNGIQTSFSSTFKFKMKLTSIPSMKKNELDAINNIKSNDPNAYYVFLPKNNFILTLDSNTMKTKAGRKIIDWLEFNVGKISFYEMKNILILEKKKFSNDESDNYYLNEKLHLNNNCP